MGIKEKLSSLGNFADKHSPEILLGIGLGGMVATIMLAIKATPKAMDSINKKKKEKSKDKLDFKETVGATWKYYIPVLLTGITASACIIGSNAIKTKRNYALAALATASETALKSYTEKVIETVGEKKEREIRNQVSQSIIDERPIRNNEVLITSKGNTLFYDPKSDRYFTSDWDQIAKIENQINFRLRSEHFIPLNELYYSLGLNPIDCGKLLGWSIDKGLLEFKGPDVCLTPDKRAAIVLVYDVVDKYEHDQNFV